jgi:hypothetical protein
MDIRYVKRISDGRIFISSEEDGLTQSNAENWIFGYYGRTMPLIMVKQCHSKRYAII